MSTNTRLAMLAALVGTASAPALAQPFETAIGGPGVAGDIVDDVLDDTILAREDATGVLGGPISVGWKTPSTFGPADMYVVQQDALGGIVWDQILSTPGRDEANEIVNTFSGGFAVAGETDIIGSPLGAPSPLGLSLTLLDAAGVPTFAHLYGGTPFIGGTQGGSDVYASTDGGYALSGRAAFPNVPVFQAPVAIKTDPLGFPVWSKYYVDPIFGIDFFASFADIHEFPASDGTLHHIVTGYVADFDGDPSTRDTLVMRLDASGGVVWSNLYRFSYGEEGLGIEVTNNLEIVVAGLNHEGGSSFMMKLDPAGGLVWYNVYYGLEAVDGSVREIGGGRLATVGRGFGPGTAVTEALLMQTGPGGVPFRTTAYGGPREEAGDALDLSPDGFYIGAHTTSYAFGGEDFYVLRTDPAGNTGCEEERQIPFEQVQPQLVQLQLRDQDLQQHITWQWEHFRPGHPVEDVCDPDPCPDCACDWAPPLGVCDFSDVVAFLSAFTSGDLCADLNGSSSLEFGDVLLFLSSFGAPCP